MCNSMYMYVCRKYKFTCYSSRLQIPVIYIDVYILTYNGSDCAISADSGQCTLKADAHSTCMHNIIINIYTCMYTYMYYIHVYYIYIYTCTVYIHIYNVHV